MMQSSVKLRRNPLPEDIKLTTTAALVLEGGGMRGLYTCGVLDAFLEARIVFSRVIGVSAGACNACSYLALQAGRGAKVIIDHIDKDYYCGHKMLMKTGNFSRRNSSITESPRSFIRLIIMLISKSVPLSMPV